MTIRRQHRWLYPIDRGQISTSIRFGTRERTLRTVRALDQVVFHLGDCRW
jgi:hypothetical protein